MKKTGTQGADELENGFPQLDDVEMLDPHSLHEAVRVVQHVIADRIPHVVEITEQEVLIVGKAVNDVVDAARAQVVESREILTQVDENSGIAVTIERLATAMEDMYKTPFDRFERYSPFGPPEAIADFLAPYVEAGCTRFNVMPVAEREEDAIDAIGEIARRLRTV